jgi:hypothetical protein
MVRFSDLIGGGSDESGDESDDARGALPGAEASPAPAAPRAGPDDGLSRFVQYAAAPSAVPDGDGGGEPAPLDASASAALLASLPAIDDTFLPSRAKRH